jgi:1,4-dihydroxy-2-naphthoate octaprenyltransferase
MRVWDYILHLRPHWQLMLSTLFMWGFLVSGGTVSPRFWVLYLIFHVVFYGGTTALNSYFDQDEGPVGGLWNPPPATRGLLVFALTIEAIGAIAVLFISRPLFVLTMVMGAVGTAYSVPPFRLKSRPWTSLLAVSIFQGMGGTAAGWLCCQSDWTTVFSLEAVLSMVATSLIVTGYYPLTQIYQREQDLRRGDISFAVQWGERCFPLAIACTLLAAVPIGIVVWRVFGVWQTYALVVGLAGLAALYYLWWRRYDESQVRENYVSMMRFGYLMTAGFYSFIIYHLVVGY